jgi:hypothetical protein
VRDNRQLRAIKAIVVDRGTFELLETSFERPALLPLRSESFDEEPIFARIPHWAH